MSIVSGCINNGKIVTFEDSQFKIYNGYLLYIGTSNKPTQPIGLKDYTRMFSKAFNLDGKLDLSHWDMSEAESLKEMFMDINIRRNRIIDLDIESLKDWDVSKVTNLTLCFQSYSGPIGALVNWNVSNVESAEGMFRHLYSLKDISELKDWDVNKIKDIKCIIWEVSYEEYDFYF